MKNRTVLVTGSNGFLARETIKQLDEKGAKVIATSLEDRPFYDLPDGAEYVQADLTKNAHEIFKGRDIQDIIHHAALFSLSAPYELLRKVNVEGTEKLLKAAVEADCEKVVVTSSGTVYAANQRRVKEGGLLGPGEVYGRSKLEQEIATMTFDYSPTKSGNLECGIVRPAVIMGPDSQYGGQVAIFTHYLMGSLLQGMTGVPNDGSYELCFVHVEDCAGLHIFMLENEMDTFNSVDNYPITNNQLADLVVEELDLPWYRSLLKGKKLPLPGGPLKFLSKFNDKGINFLKKHDLPVPTVSLDGGSVELMYVGDVSMSTEKAIAAGFKHKHPHGDVWLRELVRNNINSNWENLLGEKFSKLAGLL